MLANNNIRCPLVAHYLIMDNITYNIRNSLAFISIYMALMALLVSTVYIIMILFQSIADFPCMLQI